MHFENSFAALDIRSIQHHAAVKTPRTEQRRVKNIWTVGGRNNDYIGVRIKPVHFNQNLVERLFTLVVAAAQACATLPAYRINFVYKDDAGAVSLGLIKQVTHTAGTDTHKHLNKFGTRNAEKWNTGFTTDSFREKRFTCSRMAYEQHAFRNTRTKLDKLFRVFQKFNDFAKFFFGFISPGNIFKGDSWLVAREHTRAAFAKRHRLVIRALCLTHHQIDETADQQKWQKSADQTDPVEQVAGLGEFKPNRAIFDWFGGNTQIFHYLEGIICI